MMALIIAALLFLAQLGGLNPVRQNFGGLPVIGTQTRCQGQSGQIAGYYLNPNSNEYGVLVRVGTSVEYYCEFWQLT